MDTTKNEQRVELMKHMQQYALAALLEQMESAAKTMERSAEELRRYAKRAQEAHDKPNDGGMNVTPADVATWAINHAVGSAPTNMRIDLIAKYASDYAVATAVLKEGVR